MTTRRQFLGTSALLAFAAGAVPAFSSSVARPAPRFQAIREDIAALERARGGRLGVALLDLDSGDRTGWRADERFAMCSTFKFLLAAHILARVDAGQESLDRKLPVTKADILPWSPLTGPRAGEEMSIAELCQAIIIQSDNAGANILMAASGGPEALTAFLRSIGDTTTRIDRHEPTLNDLPLDGVSDTTTPDSMLDLMRTLLLGTVLSEPSRRQLTIWLIDNRTGGTRLRAGLPSDWRIGDKTGSSSAMANDIAIIWPPGRGPLLLTSYYWNPTGTGDARNAMLAAVARVVTKRMGGVI